ncbi:MAG: tetratricopeptide repeat protein, partial [Sandaracinaceae bacterium]
KSELVAVSSTPAPAPNAPETVTEVDPTAHEQTAPEIRSRVAAAHALRDTCEAQLGRTDDPARKAQLSYELGRIYEVELDDAAKAAEHYQAALRISSEHAAALRGARRVLARLGRDAALPALYDSEVAITRDPKGRARLLYAKARLMEEKLRQAGPALAVYREALQLDPGNLVILKAIERSLRRDKAFGPLAKVYEQLSNAVTDPALRAAWTAVRAHITESQLNDPVQAAALYEAALDADPHATAALANVKRLGAAQKRWPQLVRALRREFTLAAHEDTRLAILTTIARIQETRLGDAESAVKTLDEAHELRPSDASILEEVVRLRRASGQHREEVKALIALVERVEEKDQRARAAHRIAHLYEQVLGDADRAQIWLERTLEFDPTHRAAALALARIHEHHQRYDDAIRVWEARAKAITAPRERAAMHHRIGDMYERHLERPAAAARHHQTAIGLDPDHHEAFDALSRLWAAAGQWTELAELYERALDRAKHDEEAIVWLFRLGGIREDRLDDPSGAVSTYERILQRDANHLGALDAIVRAATRAGQHAKAVEALRKEATLTKDPERQASLLHRAAVVTARDVGDPASAIRALEEILRKRGNHRPSLESLAELLSDAGRWQEVVAAYQRLLPLTSTATEKVRLHYRVGEIFETQIGNEALAIDAYRAALALDRDFDPARDALHAALERSEKWKELGEALEERLDRLTAPEARARAATDLGALFEERLDDRTRALAMYDKAIEAVPLHRPALDARERLLTDQKDWNRLTSELETEAALLNDPFLRTQTSLRAALIRADQQGAVGPALDAFRPVFEESPDHVGAMLAVEEIYARTRDDAGLSASYEKMVSIVRDPKAQLAALQELARARAAIKGDTASVQRKVLSLAPDDPLALEALCRDAEDAGDLTTQLAMQARLASTATDARVAAYHQTRVGEILLQQEDAPGALAAFRAALGHDPTSLAATRGLSRAALAARDSTALRTASRYEAEVVRDVPVAVGLLLHAAYQHLLAEQADAAAEDYERALEMESDNERAAAGLKATLSRPDQAAKLIEILGRAATHASDPARALELHLDVANLHATWREDMAAAVAATRRALAIDGEHNRGLAALADYLTRNEQWEEAVATLEKLVPKSEGARLIDVHLKIAQLCEHRLSDTDRAARSLRSVLKRDEDNEVALASLVRLERVQGRHEEALRLAKKLLSVVVSTDRKAQVLTELAELERARGETAAAAAHAYAALGTLGPKSPSAKIYREIIEIDPQHASWENYIAALLTYLEQVRKSPVAASATYRELATVYLKAHNRPDRAIATLREGVEACPEDPGLSMALVKSLMKISAHDKALIEIRRYLRIDPWQPHSWRALAEVFRKKGEPDGAAIALAPVVGMRTATEDEQRIVRARRPRVAGAPPGILGIDGLKQIIDRNGLDEPAAALVHALSDVFGKLEGFDHERWGLAKRDRIRQGDTHAVRAFADRLGMIFGVPEYEMYIVDSPDLSNAVVYSGAPPALLVPKALESARDAVLAFHLARPLALLSRMLHPVDRVDARTLERILVGASRQFDPTFVLNEDDDEELVDAEAKRVARAIGFFSRGRIQDVATHFASSPTRNVGSWIVDVRRMAGRAALLISDDLLSAFEALGDSGTGADDLAGDLARFWVSDPAMRFRRRVAQQV